MNTDNRKLFSVKTEFRFFYETVLNREIISLV